jgi:hypothetical protein
MAMISQLTVAGISPNKNKTNSRPFLLASKLFFTFFLGFRPFIRLIRLLFFFFFFLSFLFPAPFPFGVIPCSSGTVPVLDTCVADPSVVRTTIK